MQHKRLKADINLLKQVTDIPFEFKFSDTDNTLCFTILINSDDYPKLDAKYLKCSVRLSFYDYHHYPLRPPTIHFENVIQHRELLGCTLMIENWSPLQGLKGITANLYCIYLEYLNAIQNLLIG